MKAPRRQMYLGSNHLTITQNKEEVLLVCSCARCCHCWRPCSGCSCWRLPSSAPWDCCSSCRPDCQGSRCPLLRGCIVSPTHTHTHTHQSHVWHVTINAKTLWHFANSLKGSDSFCCPSLHILLLIWSICQFLKSEHCPPQDVMHHLLMKQFMRKNGNLSAGLCKSGAHKSTEAKLMTMLFL